MPLIYDKLFQKLEKHGYSSSRIRKENILGQRSLTAMRNGTGGIDHSTIERLCSLFDCQPNDLMEYVPDNAKAAKVLLISVLNGAMSIVKDEMNEKLRHVLANTREERRSDEQKRKKIKEQIKNDIENNPALYERYLQIIASSDISPIKRKIALQKYEQDMSLYFQMTIRNLLEKEPVFSRESLENILLGDYSHFGSK